MITVIRRERKALDCLKAMAVGIEDGLRSIYFEQWRCGMQESKKEKSNEVRAGSHSDQVIYRKILRVWVEQWQTQVSAWSSAIDQVFLLQSRRIQTTCILCWAEVAAQQKEALLAAVEIMVGKGHGMCRCCLESWISWCESQAHWRQKCAQIQVELRQAWRKRNASRSLERWTKHVYIRRVAKALMGITDEGLKSMAFKAFADAVRHRKRQSQAIKLACHFLIGKSLPLWFREWCLAHAANMRLRFKLAMRAAFRQWFHWWQVRSAVSEICQERLDVVLRELLRRISTKLIIAWRREAAWRAACVEATRQAFQERRNARLEAWLHRLEREGPDDADRQRMSVHLQEWHRCYAVRMQTFAWIRETKKVRTHAVLLRAIDAWCDSALDSRRSETLRRRRHVRGALEGEDHPLAPLSAMHHMHHIFSNALNADSPRSVRSPRSARLKELSTQHKHQTAATRGTSREGHAQTHPAKAGKFHARSQSEGASTPRQQASSSARGPSVGLGHWAHKYNDWEVTMPVAGLLEPGSKPGSNEVSISPQTPIFENAGFPDSDADLTFLQERSGSAYHHHSAQSFNSLNGTPSSYERRGIQRLPQAPAWPWEGEHCSRYSDSHGGYPSILEASSGSRTASAPARRAPAASGRKAEDILRFFKRHQA